LIVREVIPMSRLANVNTTSIRDAIELGCRTMCSIFNADDHDIPFFESRVWPCAWLGWSSGFDEAHVPGRHLNALLNVQDALGIPIDESCINKHASAAFFSYSGVIPFPLNRQYIGGPLHKLFVHNLREGFHALYALVRYRGSARASELAERSIAAVQEYWRPDHVWDLPRLESLGLWVNTGDFISGLARSIGPLVKYHRSTGSAPALELAQKLREVAVARHYLPDGSYDPVRLGTHVHSITCVMSSLAQLADLLQDAQLMERVKAFYGHGLLQMRDDLGWAAEVTDQSRPADRGEGNSTGDILETALILGKWGHASYYQDAERILRGHLLPSQLRDISFISDPPNPDGQDSLRDVAGRHLGAFGFPAPYGHQPEGQSEIGFNMDIVGGSVASLCEAYRSVTGFREGIHRVNLLFDHETADIRVQSPYTHKSLEVTVKRPGALLIRIPSWADPGQMSIEGARPAGFANGYLLFAQPPVNQAISLRFPLVSQDLVMHHRTHDIRVRMQGDQVTAMDNFGMNLTYFDPIDG
jgi:hypothetical protein